MHLEGLGLDLPTVSAGSLYLTSRHATEVIVSAVTAATAFEPSVHADQVYVAWRCYQKQLDAKHEAFFSEVCLGPLCQCVVKCTRADDLSAWLSAMPIEKNNFDLTTQEFRDVRYKKPLLCIPPHFNGCGAPPSLDHFLICQQGALLSNGKMRFVMLSVTWLLCCGTKLSGNLLCLKILILLFMLYGHHSLRCYLIFVSLTLTPSPILSMHLSSFCSRLRLRRSKSILLLLMLIVLTLLHSVFQSMVQLVLTLLASLRGLLLVCHQNGRGATLRFSVRSIPEQLLQFGVPLIFCV